MCSPQPAAGSLAGGRGRWRGDLESMLRKLCSVATNNVQNPFTPFGDASLLRMANFYANVAYADVSEFDACLDLVTSLPARLMNLRDYGMAPGNPADLIVLDTSSGRDANRRIARRADG